MPPAGVLLGGARSDGVEQGGNLEPVEHLMDLGVVDRGW
jgi:hypothetical protein